MNSYKDPAYDNIEARLEDKYGLPSGGLRLIRTRGERSNADQVSSAGARSVYQIIPSTRDQFLKRYGIDAYAGPEAAAEVAAIHLRDDMRRTGSWAGAVRGYIGGPDPRRHGPVTDAYVGRVTGQPGAPTRTRQSDMPPLPALVDLDLYNTRPDQFDYARRPLGPEPRDPSASKEARRLADLASIVGPVGLPIQAPVENTPVLKVEQASEAANVAAEQERQRLATPKGENAPIGNFFARFGAAADNEWFGAQLARSLDAANPEAEEGYWDYYLQNREEIEAFAQTPRERQQLRETTSKAALAAAQADIERQRKNHAISGATGHGLAFSLLAGLTDPAGWVAGAGMGKGFQMLGIGSRMLAQTGRSGAAVASLGAEGALGNLAFTGALDAAGRTTTEEDYAMSAGFGLAMGLAMSPLVVRGKPDLETPAIAQQQIDNAMLRQAERLDQAAKNLGEGATPEQISTEAGRLAARDQEQFVLSILGDVPAHERLLHSDPNEQLTADPKVRDRVENTYGLKEAVSDDTERKLIAEHMARAEEIVARNPIDPKALDTILRAAGMESTGLRLLRSESPVAKAVGLTLLESTTGAGGRRRTAALSMHTRQMSYNRTFRGFDDAYHGFRKSEGQGLMSEFLSGKARKRFNERVYDEVEARFEQPEGRSFDSNPFVVEAADLWERGMNQMRKEMQHVDAVGAARLGPTSRGYMTHKLDARKVLTLGTRQRGRVRDIIAAQLVDPKNGFDAKFAKKLATKYLERAEDAAKGGFDVPMNLRNPEAADIVRDALKAVGVEDGELEKLMGKFSRGGADFTKRRLRLDLSEDIGDGMKLRDLFNTDVSSLYRTYARRVAGEVALAQYGIMGKKGLNELRKAITASGGSVDDVKAFDQIAAEFLNTPFGQHNHKHMDNIRTATSVARLGGMGFTQFAEYGNAIAALGIHRTFAAIGALPRLVKEVTMLSKGGQPKNPILRDLDLLGGELGLDDYQLTRWWDVKDNDVQVYSSENIGVGTRALRGAAHLHASLTGHRMINAVQTRGMAEQIVRKAMRYIREGTEDAALADMGFTPELRGAIKDDLANIARWDGNRLVELDLTKSQMSGHHLATLDQAVRRGAAQIIQRTFVGETGKWAHDGFLKMLAQFRTFGVTAVEKQWGRGVRNYGAIKSSMYLLGAMSFAVPIHIARVQSKMAGMSRSEREKYADKNLSVGALARATLNYASASGLTGDILDIGGGFASSFGGDGGEALVEAVGVRGTKGQSQLLGGVVAPGLGLVEDVWDGVHGDSAKLAKLFPGANLPYTQPIINAFAADHFDN